MVSRTYRAVTSTTIIGQDKVRRNQISQQSSRQDTGDVNHVIKQIKYHAESVSQYKPVFSLCGALWVRTQEQAVYSKSEPTDFFGIMPRTR